MVEDHNFACRADSIYLKSLKGFQRIIFAQIAVTPINQPLLIA